MIKENRVCNCCGKELDFWDLQEDLTIHKRIGYGSRYDGDEIELRLCCACFDKIIDECSVSPVMEECG